MSTAAPAHAAKVYRCGNAFQDQPCAETKAAVALPTDRLPAPKDAPACPPVTRDAAGRADHGDCTVRSTRDGQAVVAVQTRR